MTGITLLTTFAAGLASFLSPCILPLVPVYLAQLVGPGVALARADAAAAPLSAAPRLRALAHMGAFVAGFSVVFIALGATASRLGGLLAAHQTLLRQVGAVALVGFGLHVAGVVRLPWLEREGRLRWRSGRPGYASSLVIGVIFGLGWTPCVGPLLTSALILAAQAATLGAGVALLAAYALGLGIPFLLVGVAFDRVLPRLRRLAPYTPLIERVAGMLLVALGVAIWFNWLLIVSSWFTLR
ncbi:MAG TPA: cytochrome c biogenesis protein CcdA [Ktedonobacterales bacterium]|nr:cytochrome c biogenesis protein CcdA [Ktedonobacterales bacterium]